MKTCEMLSALCKSHWKLKTPVSYAIRRVPRRCKSSSVSHGVLQDSSPSVSTQTTSETDSQDDMLKSCDLVQKSCDQGEAGKVVSSEQESCQDEGHGKIFNQVNIQMLYEDMHRQLFGEGGQCLELSSPK